MTGNLRDVPTRRDQRHRDPAGKAALFTSPPIVGYGDEPDLDIHLEPGGWSPQDTDGENVVPIGSGHGDAHGAIGHVVVECSACGAHTPLSYLSFALAHLPLSVWLPPVGGVHYNRRMTCPACGEWSWVRAHWL
jgi:hypothetical protein